MAPAAEVEPDTAVLRGLVTPATPFVTATFAFSDIVGSTRLWERNRDAMALALAQHDEIINTAALRHRGYVFVAGGDSFAIVFASPDDAVNWASELPLVRPRSTP